MNSTFGRGAAATTVQVAKPAHAARSLLQPAAAAACRARMFFMATV